MMHSDHKNVFQKPLFDFNTSMGQRPCRTAYKFEKAGLGLKPMQIKSLFRMAGWLGGSSHLAGISR